MIKKLRLRFILLSSGALLALLFVIVAASGFLSYEQLESDADAVIASLAQDRSTFFDKKNHDGFRFSARSVNQETPYESRYFSVILTDADTVFSVNTEHIVSVSEDEAVEYAKAAAASQTQAGFMDQFRYWVYQTELATTIIFLDYSRSFTAFWTTLLSTCVISLAGFAVMVVLLILFSGKIVRPVAESYEKQKQFITAAGHEIRTPLTIIDADAEILEMEQGASEWLRDIQAQTKRLAGLTEDLIRLSRMDEGTRQHPWIDFPLSDIVAETAHSFEPLAAGKGLSLDCRVQPGLELYGDESAIRQLVSILMDNAIKYFDGDAAEPIRLTMEQRGQTAVLTVANPCRPIAPEQLSQLFDRFYRAEPSRNGETGGYGLGLSIAKAVAEAHKGKITASMDGDHLQILVTLPLRR